MPKSKTLNNLYIETDLSEYQNNGNPSMTIVEGELKQPIGFVHFKKDQNEQQTPRWLIR